MPSCNTYHLTWVSLTLDVGYLFTAAPAKPSHCSLPWARGIFSPLPLLTLNMEYQSRPKSRTTQNLSLSTGYACNRTGPGEARGLEMLAGGCLWGTTRDCPRTLAWGWGAAGPLYPSKAKGELPLAAPSSHARFPQTSSSLLSSHGPSLLPPLCHPAPPGTSVLCEGAGEEMSFRTAQRGWGGVPADLFIAKHPVRTLSSAACLVCLPACLPLGLFNPCLYPVAPPCTPTGLS